MYCSEEGAHCDSCELDLKENETIIFSVAETNVMAGAAITFSILGFCINFILIISLLLNQGMKQQITTPYILSVLFSDLLFSAILLPFLAVRYYTRQSESNIWQGLCTFVPVVYYVSLGAFILSLLCVTINRTCIIFFKERTKEIFNAKVRNLLIFFCWVIPLFFMVLPMTESCGKLALHEYTQSCTMLPNGSSNPDVIFSIIFFFVPSFIMGMCNIIMFVEIKIVKKVSSRKSGFFIFSIFLVFFIFEVTLLPSWLIDHIDSCFIYTGFHTAAYILVWSAAVLNPLIFLIIEPTYREAIRSLFSRLFISLQKDDALNQSEKKMRLKTVRVRLSSATGSKISL